MIWLLHHLQNLDFGNLVAMPSPIIKNTINTTAEKKSHIRMSIIVSMLFVFIINT
jgi:hypothetical protein